MKQAHQVNLRVFIKEEEDRDKIISAIPSIVGLNLNDEKLILSEESVSGFDNKKIEVIELTLTKGRHINHFLASLAKRLGKDQKKRIIKEVQTRVDEKLNFFLRLDKKSYLSENSMEVTDSGDCFHIKMSIAAFPSNKENAIRNIIRLFS